MAIEEKNSIHSIESNRSHSTVNLIIYTHNYPFGQTQEFIGTEIPYLSQVFSKVIVISFNSKQSASLQPLPAPNVYFRENRKLIYSIPSMKHIFILLNELLTNWKYLIKPKIFISLKKLISFLLMAIRTERITMKVMTEENITPSNTLLYSYWAGASAVGICWLKMALTKLVCISRFHGHDLYLERHADRFIPFRNTLLRGLDNMLFVSEHGKNYFVSRYLHANKKPNVSVSRLATIRKINNTKNIIKPLPKRSSVFNLLSCAYAVPVKRLHLIINALSLIKHHRIHWTHIGGGELFIKLLKDASAQLSELPYVSFHFTGNLSNADVINHYVSGYTHALINTSESEGGLPVSMMEAMSFGIPVISTNVGGVPEIIHNEYNGILISSNPIPEEIKVAIENMITLSCQKYKKLRINSFKTWKNNHDAKLLYPLFANFLRSLRYQK